MRSRLDMIGAEAPTKTAVVPSTTTSATVPATVAPGELSAEEKKHLAIMMGAGTAAAIGGAVLWKKHRVLGFLAGATAGSSVPCLLNEKYRTQAISNIGTQAASVGGSLMWKKHPVLGYILGSLVGGVGMQLATGTTPYKGGK